MGLLDLKAIPLHPLRGMHHRPGARGRDQESMQGTLGHTPGHTPGHTRLSQLEHFRHVFPMEPLMGRIGHMDFTPKTF